MFVAIKTNQNPTEVYLLDSAGEILHQKIWNAERKLANELLGNIEELLNESISAHSKQCHSSNDNWKNISGVIVFRGPGSFTGLRIGITVANAVAYSEQIPIVGTSGESWIADGLKKLDEKQNEEIVVPEYGAPANITKPRK